MAVYQSPEPMRPMRTAGLPARAGETLFVQGEPCTNTLELRSGIARAVNYSRGGHRQVMAFFFAGDILGFPLTAEHRYSVEAVSDLSFSVHSATGWVPGPPCSTEQALHPLGAIWREEEAFITRSLILGRVGILARIAAFLVHVSRHLSMNGEIYDFPIPQSDIASYLATSPETICRMFRQLRETNVIAIPRKDQLRLLDFRRLTMIADGQCDC